MWTVMKNWLRKTFSFNASPVEEQQATDPAQPTKAEGFLKRLEWTTVRRLDGILQGDYRTLFRGAGLDFADLREYQSHDDVRHIDWNVTARTGTPHVRVFTEDREMAAWFVMDLSASVDFGSDERRKRDVANELATVLSRVLTGHGNRVGALLYGGAGNLSGIDKLLPSGGGRRHVLHLAHELLSHRAASNGGQTDLATLLKAASQVIKRRSTVFVISDFFSTPGWSAPLQQLARRHDVTAIRLHDPLEMKLPDMGLISLRDPETGETQVVDCDAKFLRRFEELASKQEASLRGQLASSGVDTLEISTQDDLADVLIRFCALRRRKSRHRTSQNLNSLAQAA
jgi:uncharacterized protein (DUF58 family)